MSLSHHPSNSSDRRNSRNYVALGMIGGAFVGVVALTTPFVAMQLRSPLPYMATPKRKVERALAFASQRRGATTSKKASSNAGPARQPLKSNRKKLNFVDLGSGDGTTILAAASLGWSATGMELNPTLWFVSSLRRLFSPRTIRANSRMVWGDMFESGVARERLRGADCVMVFGVKPLMPKVAELVRRECAPGCMLMSYRFRVPLLADEMCAPKDKDDFANCEKDKLNGASSSGGGIDATLIYDEEEMRIYELETK